MIICTNMQKKKKNAQHWHIFNMQVSILLPVCWHSLHTYAILTFKWLISSGPSMPVTLTACGESRSIRGCCPACQYVLWERWLMIKLSESDGEVKGLFAPALFKPELQRLMKGTASPASPKHCVVPQLHAVEFEPATNGCLFMSVDVAIYSTTSLTSRWLRRNVTWNSELHQVHGDSDRDSDRDSDSWCPGGKLRHTSSVGLRVYKSL